MSLSTVYGRLARPLLSTIDTVRGRGERDIKPGPDGRPLPPERMLITITGANQVDHAWFWRVGRQDYESLKTVAAQAGIPAERMDAVLDFGGGLGRIARHWIDDAPAIHLADYNRPVVKWVQNHLPQIAAVQNGIEPPLPYDDGTFDLLYAFSVFTHFDEGQQHTWLAEVQRVLKPGGIAVLSLFGDREGEAGLEPPDLERFRAGEIIVSRGYITSSNACLAWVPQRWLRENLPAGLELERHWDAHDYWWKTTHDFVQLRRVT